MIKSNISIKFPHLYAKIVKFDKHIYVADYTEHTKLITPKRDVEIFSPNPCTDIDYFSIKNPSDIEVDTIILDNNSFTYQNGQSRSQCETTMFPSNSDANSWFLLTELKYSINPNKNSKNLRKAIKQLLKTRYYYIQELIITKTNNQYLIASLPMQGEPFANFSLTPSFLLNLKIKRNVILRLKNSVEIQDDKIIKV